MKIGLVSYLSKKRDISFNMQQIELPFKRSIGKVDLLCFGEAFIQGFESFCWNYVIDKDIALSLSSDLISQLKKWSIQYGISLITEYIEKNQEKLYSSCVVCNIKW